MLFENNAIFCLIKLNSCTISYYLLTLKYILSSKFQLKCTFNKLIRRKVTSYHKETLTNKIVIIF